MKYLGINISTPREEMLVLCRLSAASCQAGLTIKWYPEQGDTENTPHTLQPGLINYLK